MAKPIQLDFPARDRRAEVQQRLAEAPAEHAAAILEFLELLEVLHERKVLSTLRGAFGAGGDLAGYIAHASAQPESIRALRNAITIAKILGQIDPELLEAIQQSVPQRSADQLQSRAPGLWRTIRILSSPSARRTIFAAGLILVGIGKYLERSRRNS